MRNLIFTLCLLTLGFTVQAQFSTVYTENFETATAPDSVTTTGNPLWSGNTTLAAGGTRCYQSNVVVGDTSTMATFSFNTTGNFLVFFTFDHICKIEFFDAAIVEASSDGGVNWTRLDTSHYRGNSLNFGPSGNKFSEASYTTWEPGLNNPPTNAWWQSDTFDISLVVPNTANAQIRFRLYDSNNIPAPLKAGWFIDNINVQMAFSEMDPPKIVQQNPILQGLVYNLGPYTLRATITDQSGIATANMHYTVNSGPDNIVAMTNTMGNTWEAMIPAALDSDTICYYFECTDASPLALTDTTPGIGCRQFVASSGILFPFFDNFDTGSMLWNDSVGGGTTMWELGTPTTALLNSAFSAPNSWTTDLDADYGPNSRIFLTSPVFNFDASSTINAELSFWQNREAESFWDGTRLEYTINNGLTWTVLGTVGDPNAVNWYTHATLNSSGLPGWSGNSAGWQQSKYTLVPLNSVTGPVRFRFVFTSDGSVQQEGMSIDNFLIVLPSPQDAGVSAINYPVGQRPAGTTDSVSVEIENFGTQAITALNVVYTIDGTVIATEPWTGNLAPGATTNYDFIAQYTVPTGQYDVCAYTVLAGDGNHLNDTLCGSVQGVPYLAPNYFTDFDGASSVWFNQSNTIGTDWEWGTPNFGATNSAFSAPNSWDINLVVPYGPNAQSYLYSPIFDLSAAVNATMSFQMNHNIALFGDGVNIQYTTDGATWLTLGTVGDPNAGINGWYNNASVTGLGFQAGWDGNSGGWIGYEYLLSSFNNEPYFQVRYQFGSNGFTQSDGVSVDEFSIILPSPFDAGVVGIERPLGLCVANDTCDVRVVVRNFGTNNITTMDVGYIANGGAPVVTAWTGNLAPSATDTVDLPIFIAPLGQFTFCAYTDLAADGNSFNDTLCASPIPVGVPTVPLNYADDYDGANAGWVAQGVGATTWQLGPPSFGATNSANSAPNAWDVNLTTGYTANAECYLLSPYFNFSNANNATLRFWQNRNTEAFWDGTRIDYSFDGVNWTVLGSGPVPPDPLGINWYTDASLNSSQLPGWDGNSNGWVLSEYNLMNFNFIPVVQFRYVFTSDGSVQVDGQSIDDFSIKIPAPFDVGVSAITAPTVEVDTGTTVPVFVDIRNFGTNPITTVDICYTINGQLPATTFTWIGPALAPNMITNVQLPPFVAPIGTIEICAWTKLPADGDLTNDTTCSEVTGVPVIPVEYCDEHDLAGTFWSHDGGFDQWERGTPAGTVIDSAYTAPNAWATNLAGIYANNSNDFLYTPKFDFSGAVDAEIQIWHWINAEANDDGGRVEISTDGGVSWATVGSGPVPTDPRANNWYTNATLFGSGQPGWSGTSPGYQFSSYKLDQYNNANQPVRFRFNFSANGFTNNFDGWAIDNFCIFVPIPLTAAPEEIDANNPILLPGPQDMSCYVENRGTMDISDLWVTLNIDGNTIVTDSLRFLPALEPGDRRKHFFTVPWQSSPGAHDVCVWTFNPNDQLDQNQSDDTTCVVLTVFDSTSVFPFCSDFESGPQWVALNAISYKPQSTWELGTPAQTTISGANSGANAWMTKLDVNYPNKDSSAVFTPVFNVKGGACYKISFEHIYDTEQFQDGGTVEYSIDNAQNWQVAGFGGEPLWMNSFYIASFGGPPTTPGWSGTAPGWEAAEYYIYFNNDENVIFRFRFASDNTVTQEGWAIDDFCFEREQGPCVIGIDENESSPVMLWQNQPNPAYNNTSFDYNIPSDGQVSITLTNVIGQNISTLVDANMPAGRHTVNVETIDLEAGVYYYTLRYKDIKLVRKMVILE